MIHYSDDVPSIDDLLADARQRLGRLAPRTAYDAMLAGTTLVDVRTREQLDQHGRIPDALTIALNVAPNVVGTDALALARLADCRQVAHQPAITVALGYLDGVLRHTAAESGMSADAPGVAVGSRVAGPVCRRRVSWSGRRVAVMIQMAAPRCTPSWVWSVSAARTASIAAVRS